jgi:hypothetical protein
MITRIQTQQDVIKITGTSKGKRVTRGYLFIPLRVALKEFQTFIK